MVMLSVHDLRLLSRVEVASRFLPVQWIGLLRPLEIL